jgi:uncharacterized protein (DUF305 family)
MTRSIARILATAALTTAAAACASSGAAAGAAAGTPAAAGSTAHAAHAAATPGTAAPKVNAADVHFMSGMIPHHAQAVLIAGWAPSHGARPDIQRLAERIVVAQKDEIQLMQDWLRQRGQPVPAANATHLTMEHNGMKHDMLMPGMLTEAELKRLDAARGSEFDRLFLQAMIGHHKGAISMVDELETADGSRQDETVFRFSQDVYADQTTEIRVMEQLLATIK